MILLLDLSGSTREKIKAMKKAAKNFIDSLGTEDRIAVAAFTRRFTVVSDFTADRKALKKRIDGIKNQRSGTAYYDAMWAALDLLRRKTDRRKALVVLTDGVDNSITYPDRYESRHAFEELSMRLAEEDATVYPIYFDTEYDVVVNQRLDRHESYATARRQLQEVADQTGGLLFKAARVEDLKGVYERVAAELRTFYSLGYSPLKADTDGSWRAISVQVDRPRARVRTKRGYYAR
jgi:VWFA-related protein